MHDGSIKEFVLVSVSVSPGEQGTKEDEGGGSEGTANDKAKRGNLLQASVILHEVRPRVVEVEVDLPLRRVVGGIRP